MKLDYSMEKAVGRNTERKNDRKEAESMREHMPIAYLKEMYWY